eukprot:6480195-Amphidinium_carterae.1
MSKKAGLGGAQRAFVSLMTKGKRGTPDFKALGALFQEHRQANSDVFQEATRKGKLATAKAKARQGSFGPPVRDQRRKQARSANKLIPLGHHASSSLVLHGSADGSQGVSHMSDMDGLLQKVRAQAKAEATRTRLQKDVSKQALQKFAEVAGQESVEKLVQGIPELMPFADSLHAIPWKNHQAIKCVFQCLEDAIHVANFAQAQSHASDLAKALEADWQRVNKAIDSSTCLPEVKSERGGVPKCLKQGYCTCHGEGQQVGKFRNEFYKVLKRVFPRGVAEKKKLLASACIVVAFKGEAEKSFKSSGWDDACEELCLDEDNQALHTSGTHWAHIGAHYFKPYRSSLQVLEYVGEKGDQHILQQSGVFKSLFEFVATLSLQSKWSVECWQIVESLEPVHAFNPRVCCVKKLAGSEEVWGPKKNKKGAKGGGGTQAKHRATELILEGPGSPEVELDDNQSEAESGHAVSEGDCEWSLASSEGTASDKDEEGDEDYTLELEELLTQSCVVLGADAPSDAEEEVVGEELPAVAVLEPGIGEKEKSEEVETVWEGNATSTMQGVEAADGELQLAGQSVEPTIAVETPAGVASKVAGSLLPRAPADYTLLLP